MLACSTSRDIGLLYFLYDEPSRLLMKLYIHSIVSVNINLMHSFRYPRDSSPASINGSTSRHSARCQRTDIPKKSNLMASTLASSSFSGPGPFETSLPSTTHPFFQTKYRELAANGFNLCTVDTNIFKNFITHNVFPTSLLIETFPSLWAAARTARNDNWKLRKELVMQLCTRPEGTRSDTINPSDLLRLSAYYAHAQIRQRNAEMEVSGRWERQMRLWDQ